MKESTPQNATQRRTVGKVWWGGGTGGGADNCKERVCNARLLRYNTNLGAENANGDTERGITPLFLWSRWGVAGGEGSLVA
jgi:hypothetical protein